ncbi:hypothetical protein evm_002917 [Chilo suppressalis]|nr:hypothetical protein evm_002917 [Chilo suppressalis]
MPKIIELTVELEVQKVSCPGVWLCQDGRVSLSVFLLGTSYQTCMLPPIFPLMFKDIFYFRKRFQESCALNNICCILKEETIYCELVQWSDDCHTGVCTVLAQYLGALNDVLFPPNMCSNDGVDLLMRRAKQFPGILSPKIEIATKVRIDEVWEQPCNLKPLRATSCHCSPRDADGSRQKQVCHSAQYHRNKCSKRAPSVSRARSRSRSQGSTKSCCSLTPEPAKTMCGCAKSFDGLEKYKTNPVVLPEEDRIHKSLLESRYIDQEPIFESKLNERAVKRHHFQTKFQPCVCEICKKYHELFHANDSRI